MFPAPGKCRQSCHWAKRNISRLDFNFAESFGGSSAPRGPSKHSLSCHCAKRNMLDFRSLTLPSPSEEALCSPLSANVVCPAIVQSETCLILGL